MPDTKRARADGVVINVAVDHDLHRQLRVRCVERDMALREAIEEAVTEWLAAPS